MAPSSALAFICAGFALTMRNAPKPALRFLTHALTIVLVVISYAALVGYIFEKSALEGNVVYSTMSLNAAIALFLLAAGILCSQPERGVMAVLVQQNPAGTTIRRMLPIIVATPIIVGWLRLEGERASYYGTKLGIALMVTSSTVVIGFIAIWNAGSQGRRQHQLDLERQNERFLNDLGELTRRTRSSALLLENAAQLMQTGMSADRCHFEVFDRETPEDETPIGKTPALSEGQHELTISLGFDGTRSAMLTIIHSEGANEADRIEDLAKEASKRVWLGYLQLYANEARQASEQSLAVTLESIADGVVSTDEDGLIISMNANAEHLTGWLRCDAIGKPGSEVVQILASDASSDEMHFMELAAKGTLHEGQVSGVLTQRDATQLPVSASIAPIRDAAGVILGAVSVFRDVSAEKRSLEKFRLALEASPSGMILVDLKGHIALINDQVEQLFGYSRAELMGTKVATLVPNLFDVEPSELADSKLPRVTQQVPPRELIGRHKDDQVFPVEVGMNPVETSKGSHIICSVADITARKHEEENRIAMARIQNVNQELEQRVAERTKELRNNLREREVLLQEVHHRVKNNLQIISSLMNLQIRQVGDSAARSALLDCKGRIEAIALVHDRLYQSDDYANVPFSDYAESFVNAVFRATGVGGGRIRAKMQVSAIDLPVDTAISVGLIINELVTNAIKHAFPDGREGSIYVVLAPHGNHQIRLSVRDTGIGLASGKAESDTESLGMMLVNTLVEQLEAQLHVETDGGTNFTVIFQAPDTAMV